MISSLPCWDAGTLTALETVRAPSFISRKLSALTKASSSGKEKLTTLTLSLLERTVKEKLSPSWTVGVSSVKDSSKASLRELSRTQERETERMRHSSMRMILLMGCL